MASLVTTKDMIDGFKETGVLQNDKLVVHSSLSSFGKVEGSALVVINALQRIVGYGGVLMMPTFTYGHEPFDIRHTPSKTGKITEVFRLLPNVIRSKHPGFSFAAWGAKASNFVAGHDTEVGIGRGTPIHRIIEEGAKILLIGVDQTANSTLHLAQDLAQVPYLNRYRMTEIVEADGKLRLFRIRRAGCSLGFNKIQLTIDKAKIEKRIMIGKSMVRVLLGASLLKLAIDLFKEEPGSLLCDQKECPSCEEAREMIAAYPTQRK